MSEQTLEKKVENSQSQETKTIEFKAKLIRTPSRLNDSWSSSYEIVKVRLEYDNEKIRISVFGGEEEKAPYCISNEMSIEKLVNTRIDGSVSVLGINIPLSKLKKVLPEEIYKHHFSLLYQQEPILDTYEKTA